MFANLTGWHLLIVLAGAARLFGAANLRALARAVSLSARIARSETRGMQEDADRHQDQASDSHRRQDS
jgi:sec-independent protein translocase protein TatA